MADTRAVTRRGLLSVEEAAEYLGIAVGTLRNWISMKQIEHVKVGRLTRISQGTLDKYISVHTIRAIGDHE
jgi:excisionase family DNA binding protein